MIKVKDTNSFIEKAKYVHGNTYDYSLAEYIKTNKKIKIICSVHGIFEQLPNNHLRGNKCSFCYKKKRLNTKTFIERAIKIHGSEYDYSLVDYKNMFSKVILICKIHSKIEQTPLVHLTGSGCFECYGMKNNTTEQILEKFKEIHNDTYDYSFISYKNLTEKLLITCKTHGEFKQSANSHIQGHGCPKCISRISKPEIAWLNSKNISEQQRQILLRIDGRIFKADAYDFVINTIYEFYGDYWHGNPKMYNQNDLHPLRKITYDSLYKETLEKENVLKQSGYNLVIIWESDWKNYKKYLKHNNLEHKLYINEIYADYSGGW